MEVVRLVEEVHDEGVTAVDGLDTDAVHGRVRGQRLNEAVLCGSGGLQIARDGHRLTVPMWRSAPSIRPSSARIRSARSRGPRSGVPRHADEVKDQAAAPHLLRA